MPVFQLRSECFLFTFTFPLRFQLLFECLTVLKRQIGNNLSFTQFGFEMISSFAVNQSCSLAVDFYGISHIAEEVNAAFDDFSR